MAKAKQLRTREKILQHGLALLSQSGLGGVSLGQLADHVGMSKSGLFAHFESKEDVQIDLLDRAVEVSRATVVMPAMRVAGRARLEALVTNWFGWTERAGLPGGCPVAAAMFELDDAKGAVRDHVLALEKEWRSLLSQCAREAIALGEFRRDLDVEQFVFELCGFYLSHHASHRFVREPQADRRAKTAVRELMARAATDKSPHKIKPERRR